MMPQVFHPNTNTDVILTQKFLDPNTNTPFRPFPIRDNTLKLLQFFAFKDDHGNPIQWTQGQLEIIDCIVNRSSIDGLKRIEIIASTQYGKSLAVAAGVVIRACMKPEQWALVAGTTEKARIIMEYCIMLALNSDIVRSQLNPETPLDKLRMKRSADRLVFKKLGQIRVYSADATRVQETSKALMGFGSPNVIEDESALIGDVLQSTVMRMLGGYQDNFLIKIGNPFNRNHFLRTWQEGKYARIFIDYNRALAEGRYTKDFIEEMRAEAMFDILYECRFPLAGMIEAGGWLQLLTEDQVRRALVKGEQIFGQMRLGADVAGGGRNFSTMVLRGYNAAHLLYKKNTPDTMQFCGEIQAVAMQMRVGDNEIFADTVGVGKGLVDRLKEMQKGVGVNAGSEPSDKTRFVNKRAEMYWRGREWILRGGKLNDDGTTDWYQLCQIRYKVTDSSGKLIIMSKEEMLKNQIDSPDVADAFSLTFYRGEETPALEHTVNVDTSMNPASLDPYA
jgi:hypothetical protein